MGTGNKAEMIIAVCAVITSVVALFIGWDQARIMRLQQKAEIWPMVQVTHLNDVRNGAATYSLELENAGVGPALIESHLILMPDGSGTDDFNEMLAYLMPEMSGEASKGFVAIDSRVIRQGTVVRPIHAAWDANERNIAAMQQVVDDFVSGARKAPGVFVCYCSILDECWVSSTLGDQARPAKVKSCTTLERDARNLVALYGD